MASFFNPIECVKNIDSAYRRYIKTTFHTNVDSYNEQLTKAIDEYELVKGPFIQIAKKYSKGPTIDQLVEEGILSEQFRRLHSDILPTEMKLYEHQYKAVENIICNDRNTVVSTGTGSGKTESFLLPIINCLMREVEDGTISEPGVRAMIIYPMNALVNDQMDRMAKLLENYPAIRFGFFTGETRDMNRPEDFQDRFSRRPLKNEEYTRERLRSNPPHILITNYAMLEHILILPENSVQIFDPAYSDKWKYIVLDEAHTYGGAKGSEISILLRRVQTTIGSDKIRFILTSATLGSGSDADSEVARFASDLTTHPFDETDIIRATFETTARPEILGDAPIGFYQSILTNSSSGLKVPEDAWKTVFSDSKYWKIIDAIVDSKNKLLSPRDLSLQSGIAMDDLISMLNACAIIKDQEGSKMLDARYHTFITTLDGIFITLSPSNRISMVRSDTYHDPELDEDLPQFILSTCYNCNAIYIPGRVVNNRLLNLDSSYIYDEDGMENNSELYLLCSKEDFDPEQSDLFYTLCSKCRTIRNHSMKPMCDCGPRYENTLMAVKPPEKEKLCTCRKCGQKNNKFGIVRDFYLGSEAASAVIATALYNSMPEPFKNSERDESSNPIKQFLLFSDSRKSASYAAVNLEETYQNLLMHRVMKSMVDDDLDSFSTGVGFESFRTVFENKMRSLTRGIEIGSEDLENAINMSLVKEIAGSNSNKSLEYMGLLSFEYDFKNEIPGLSREESHALLNTMLKSVREKGAIRHTITKSDSDRRFIHNNGVISKTDGKGTSVFLTSRMMKYLSKALYDNDVLRDRVVDKFFRDTGCFAQDKKGYSIEVENLIIRTHRAIYECSKCKKHYPYSVRNICPNCCTETLSMIDSPIDVSDDHYASLYRSMPLDWLEVHEHTAQLDRKLLSKYQNEFKEQKINALCCSTTFEMGIDIGTLSYVLLRNVPPTPSNYAQRAGRAGRSRNSSAFILTFCKNSSHDRHYFDNPQDMIAGDIATPRINPSNPKIVLRHIFATAIGFYWKKLGKSPDKFNEMADKAYMDAFKAFLSSGDKALDSFLESFVPSDLKCYSSGNISIDLDRRSWVGSLIDDNAGRLSTCIAEFNGDLSKLNTEKKNCMDNGKDKIATYYQRSIANMQKLDVLSGLSKGNVIPRYGFPIDIVPLQHASNYGYDDDLSLQRDISYAISEYAPECQVVANGQLITSTHLKTIQGLNWPFYRYGICDKCRTAFTDIAAGPSDEIKTTTCPNCSCEVDIDKNMVIPAFGFVYKNAVKATINKPRRSRGCSVHYKGGPSPNIRQFRIGEITGTLCINADDELVEVTNDIYCICRSCGYGCRGKPPNSHKTSSGIECNRPMSKLKLGNIFRTDVAIIHFDVRIEDPEQALSTLYSLIEALCIRIQVERSEISGCVRFCPDDTADFILFDCTPGGSGYVKSISERMLPELIYDAICIVSRCTCGGEKGDGSCYRCLQSYYNQQYHQKLRRGLAKNLLTDIKKKMVS